MEEIGKASKQITAGDEVVKLCNKVMEKAHDVLKLTEDKLSPLYISTPKTENLKPAGVTSFPAYFDGLRNNLQSTFNALNEIEYTINKIDL